jgi:hypothetical protein
VFSLGVVEIWWNLSAPDIALRASSSSLCLRADASNGLQHNADCEQQDACGLDAEVASSNGLQRTVGALEGRLLLLTFGFVARFPFSNLVDSPCMTSLASAQVLTLGAGGSHAPRSLWNHRLRDRCARRVRSRRRFSRNVTSSGVTGWPKDLICRRAWLTRFRTSKSRWNIGEPDERRALTGRGSFPHYWRLQRRGRWFEPSTAHDSKLQVEGTFVVERYPPSRMLVRAADPTEIPRTRWQRG